MKPFSQTRQRGVLLLEALIAILIFSIGILAVIGMQAVSVQNVAEAKYRTDASFLANEIIGQMWTNRANLPTFAYAGGAAPAQISTWVAKVQNEMPGVTTAANFPIIAVPAPATFTFGTSTHLAYQVQITVRWQTPKEASLNPQPPPHSYTTSAYFEYCAPVSGVSLC